MLQTLHEATYEKGSILGRGASGVACAEGVPRVEDVDRSVYRRIWRGTRGWIWRAKSLDKLGEHQHSWIDQVALCNGSFCLL